MIDNPKAFSCATPSDAVFWNEGMDLRDYFAGQIVTGIISNSENAYAGAEPTNSALSTNSDFAEWIARTSYRVADAMLAERMKS